jgi:hypothetical protein
MVAVLLKIYAAIVLVLFKPGIFIVGELWQPGRCAHFVSSGIRTSSAADFAPIFFIAFSAMHLFLR